MSAKNGAYYANPRNRFWRILHECGFTETELQSHDFARLQLQNMGLTDLCKFAFGNDDELSASDLNVERLIEAIQKYQPAFLAFTSRNAGRMLCGKSAGYGWQASQHGARIYILPTTSPRWGEHWWSEQKHHWHDFAKAVHSS
jgi:double-stranded uracil-DNA glycosylase